MNNVWRRDNDSNFQQKAHRHWTVDDWKRVIWSDESAIQKDSNAMGVWVFRHQNKREKYAPWNVRTKARDGSLSQMIWACFVGDKLGPIVFISGSVNQDVYWEMLRTEFDLCFLRPWLQILK